MKIKYLLKILTGREVIGMRSPLLKRLPREFKSELGKYIAIFLFMTLTIGFISKYIKIFIKSYKVTKNYQEVKMQLYVCLKTEKM